MCTAGLSEELSTGRVSKMKPAGFVLLVEVDFPTGWRGPTRPDTPRAVRYSRHELSAKGVKSGHGLKVLCGFIWLFLWL